MIRKFLLAFIALTAASQAAFAALPPLPQGIAEYKAILNSEELVNNLDISEILQGIHHVPSGYIVLTNKHEMFVEVLPAQSGIGPLKFDLKFHPPVPLNVK